MFNFQKVSTIGQALLFYLTFMQLVQLCISLTSQLSAGVEPSMTVILLFYWGSQIIGLGLLVWLFWKVNRLSNQEGKLVKANLISMVVFCSILLITVAHAYLSPFGFVLTNPMILSVVPNTLVLIVFMILVVMTVRAWKRNKQRVALS